MNLHRNAKLSVKGRELLVDRAGGSLATRLKGPRGFWIVPQLLAWSLIASTSVGSRQSLLSDGCG
jgi:hypothetical protein